MYRHHKASKPSYNWQRIKKGNISAVAMLEVLEINVQIGLLLNGKESK